MESAEHGGLRVVWDARERVAQFHARSDRDFTGEAAEVIIPHFAEWVGGAPYGILVDATEVTAAAGDWRMRWARYHKEEGGLARIAIVQPNLFVRTLLAGYSRITGTPLRAFPREDDARAWLRRELHPQ